MIIILITVHNSMITEKTRQEKQKVVKTKKYNKNKDGERKVTVYHKKENGEMN